jgi:hypothetical protein
MGSTLFDSIGVPSATEIDAFGTEHQPGGFWQRQATIQWMERIAGILHSGESVLFEGQMRIAFIREAVATYRIGTARILLVDCPDDTRISRLTDQGRQQLANPDMMNWSHYLREEALEAGCEILDTGASTLADNAEVLFVDRPSEGQKLGAQLNPWCEARKCRERPYDGTQCPSVRLSRNHLCSCCAFL